MPMMLSRSARRKIRACLVVSISTTIPLIAVKSAHGDAYDPPTGYYAAAIGTGATLKHNLYVITKTGFVQQTYGDSRYTLNQLWQDPNNSANLTEIYTSTSVNGTWDGGVTGSWNREHLIPEHFLGISNIENTNHTYGADEFELAPADPNVNSSRGDGGYGYTGSAIPPNGYGNVTGTDGNVYWNAGVQFKGDTARSLFYMATRYGEGQGTGVDAGNTYNIVLGNGAPTLTPANGSTPAYTTMGDLNTLLHWAYEDPVDTFERRKNELVYTGMTASQISGSASQGNRNPYIDHPEYIWAVFGTSANDSQISVGTPTSNGSSTAMVNLGRVITGSSFSTSNVTVSKTGTTPTTFNVTTAGSATSTLAGSGETFNYSAGSKTMSVGLSTPSTAGAVSGTITVDNTDLTSAGAGEGVADGDDTVNVLGTVVDHSNASFSSISTVKQLTLNFGTFAQNSGTEALGFSIADLLSASGYTAGLKLTSISGTGSTTALYTNLGTFTDETAGTTDNFSADLSTASAGTYSAEYTLAVSDENIPGATAGQSLILDLTGNVINSVPEPSALILLPIASLILLGRRPSGVRALPATVPIAG